MNVKKGSVIILIALVLIVGGCLFKPPAEVRFSVDRTQVKPEDTIHVMVTINNTGKVGLTGATLILGDDNFQILQEPKFPEILPVGKTTQLVWILKAPAKPGIYNLKLSLELTDELKRTWTGFYGQFRIVVSRDIQSPEEVKLTVNAPEIIEGGKEFEMSVKIENTLGVPITVEGLDIDILDGMEITAADTLPPIVKSGGKSTVRYTIKAPYAYREGYVSVILRYSTADGRDKLIQSVPIKVIWRPWNQSEEVLEKAYGLKYHWITDSAIVDGYWEKKYNSTSEFNRKYLQSMALEKVINAESEYQAAERIFKWMIDTYSFGDTTSTLNPEKIVQQDRISYVEAQILFTAMLRSVNVPARLVTLFNGTDCTMRPITEFYTLDGWYVVDVRHGFLGSIEDYVASPYFPKLYQLATMEGYRIVAQAPNEGKGHEHVDVTGDFLADLEDRLLKKVTDNVRPELRAKLMVVINNLDDNERLYALFIFASAPNEDALNNVLSTWSADRIQKNIKAMYEFYRDIPWRDDFTYYWRIFVGEV